MAGGLTAAPLALYAAGIAWTLGYDTIYAHQDKEDDALIGVKSTALKLAAGTRPWLWAFYGLAMAGLGLAGWLAGLGPWFWPLLGLGGAQLAWQAGRVRIDDAADCLAKFKSNAWFGWLYLGAILAGKLA